MKQFSLLLALIGFGLGACERHDWESKPGKPGTIEFFKHGDGDSANHGEEKESK